MAPVEEMSVLDFDRSNKGASKQRRDQINAEIATMRDLLPLPESSRQRLSQLQIMSLTCVYVRKCNILHKLFRSKSQEKLPDSTDFFQALSGFVLVTTRDGKLLYISENVTDYLGHSMVDMKTQGDSLYDIVDKRDHGAVQAQLLHGAPRHARTAASNSADNVDSAEDVSFFCRMNMSRTLKRQSGFGDVKVMHVRGHFITMRGTSEGESLAESSSSSCVFMATCSPLITPDLKETLVQSNTMVFKTVHKLDMSFIEMTNNAEHHLGCNSKDLAGKSWYTVLHPEDIHQAKDKHMQLIHSNHEVGCMVTVRMLRADGTSFWVNSVMQIRQSSLPQSDDAYIVCISQIIDENEAYQIKLHSHMFSVYPSRAHELWGNHLSSMTTGSSMHDHLQQAGGAAPNHHWIQQEGAADLPMPSYHGNMSTSNMAPYQMQVGAGAHRMMPYQQPLGPQASIMTAPHRHGAIAQLNHAQPLVQSDQLKAMLKRKIKGPQQTQQHPDCKPLKIPRLDTLNDTGMWPCKKPGALGIGSVYPTQYHPRGQQQQLTSSFQHMPYNEQSVQLMQVMQPECYVFGTKPSVSLGFKNVLPAMSNKDSSLTMMGSEQVVPDVNVPESFLTPEPSPASSPQPAASYLAKSAGQTACGEKGSFTILQALEKLAAMPHQLKSQGSTLEVVKVVSTSDVGSSQDLGTQRKTELPIFDAFDIDNFFDALEPPVGRSKESHKMKQVQVKQEIKSEDSTKSSVRLDDSPDQVFIKCEALSPPSSVPSMSPEHRATAQASPGHNYQQQQQQIRLKSEYPTSSSCMRVSTLSQPNKTAVPVMSMPIMVKMGSTANMSPLHSSSCSPASACPKQESLDELLHYFSEESTDLCPLQLADSLQITCESSVSSDGLLDEDYFLLRQQRRELGNSCGSTSSLMHSEPSRVMPSNLLSHTKEMKHQQPHYCQDVLSPPCLEELSPEHQPAHKAAELSPASSASSLAGEDELLEERAAFTFDLALEMLDTQGQDERAPLSVKDSDVLNFPDELGFILESLVPSENALEMIKHGQ